MDGGAAVIYLDCAATALQKPKSVHRAVQHAMEHMTGPGRGSHRAAMAAADTVYRCREMVAQMFHAPSVDSVVFTFNATHGLNIAIHDLVGAGDHVVVSGYEHNAVMRPLYQRNAKVNILRTPLFDEEAMVTAFARALPEAKVAICTAVSNVFGYILPLGRIAELCQLYNVPLIVDASQAAGSLALDFHALGATYMAFPGHKGLLGPQGTGVLLCGRVPEPLLSGGTGADSRRLSMPQLLPDRAEAGTHNVPGIAGLLAGMEYIQKTGVETIAAHERELRQLFCHQLQRFAPVELFTAPQSSQQSGVVSLRCRQSDTEALCEALDRAGVAVRGGLHCAPTAHDTVGTGDTGTVRFSFSPFNSQRDALMAAELTKQCVNNLKS